jgi:hypothetical protein
VWKEPPQPEHTVVRVRARPRDACALSRLTSSRFRVGDKVRAAGVAFFDFNHGQTGHANNYLELHPPCGGAAVLEAVAPSFRPTGV